MAKKSSTRGGVPGGLPFGHAGREIPKAALRRALAHAQKRPPRTDPEKLRLLREAAKHRRALTNPLDEKDPRIAAALAGLRGVADKISKRKVRAPIVPRVTPGILAGAYTLRLTPNYYGYGHAEAWPSDGRNSAFVTRSTGELGLEFASKQDTFAHANASIGVAFVPPFRSGHLRARINPALSYAWWVVTKGSPCLTLASMYLDIGAYRWDGSYDAFAGSADTVVWFQEGDTDLAFDFGSSSDNPMSAGLRVDSDHFYVINLVCFGQAYGSDDSHYPADAGGILNVALPYIDLDLQVDPVVTVSL